MITERLVISDTNIFLDLMSVNLLEEFFQLPCKIETTDFVIDEIIQPNQLASVQNFVSSKILDVISFSFEELIKINDIFDNLIEYKIITKEEAANLLETLISINSRLPKGECEKRILKWQNS